MTTTNNNTIMVMKKMMMMTMKSSGAVEYDDNDAKDSADWMRHFLFVDEDRVVNGLLQKVAALYQEEKRTWEYWMWSISRQRGQSHDYYPRGTIGWCRRRPCQILSPFDLPLGPFRTRYFETLQEVRTGLVVLI
jgi:hypothetical protein